MQGEAGVQVERGRPPRIWFRRRWRMQARTPALPGVFLLGPVLYHRPMDPELPADADPIELDLARFFGPRGETYLAYYRHWRRHSTNDRRWPFVLAWSWPAFGFSMAWFWYRKLWGFGLAAVAIPALGGWLPTAGLGSPIGYLMVAALAKDWYLRAALRAVGDADESGLSGEARAAFLAARGGVAPWAGLAGALVVAALSAASALAALPAIVDQLTDAGLLPPF
jgi:hypothetical protein